MELILIRDIKEELYDRMSQAIERAIKARDEIEEDIEHIETMQSLLNLDPREDR